MSYKSFKQIMNESTLPNGSSTMFGYVFEGKVLSYTEYLLSEGISPSVTPFGTDFSNMEWKELNDSTCVTFFEHKDNYYVVIYNNGYIGFATNYTNTREEVLDIINKVRTFDQLWMNFHFNRKPIPNAISVFNKSFYVMLVAIKHFKPETIRFNAYTPMLRELYETLINNKSFINTITEYGYKYTGIEINDNKEFFTFKESTNE